MMHSWARILVLVLIGGGMLAVPQASVCAGCGSPPPCTGRCPNPAWWTSYSIWCRCIGGTPYQDASGGGCRPGSGKSSSGSAGSSAGGYTSRQQAMLSIAGALGSALGNSIRESMEADERRRQEELLAALQRAEEERIRYEAEQQRLAAEREAKHRQLLGALRGGLGSTELGLKGMESHTLALKEGSNLFNTPSNPTGSLTMEAPTRGLALKSLDEPPTPVGKTVSPGEPIPIEKAFQDYQAALNRRKETQAQVQQLERDRQTAETIKREAERQVQEQKAALAQVQPDQAEQKKLEEDKLARAQKLLDEATQMDQDVARELEKARREAEQAEKQLTEARAKQRQSAKTQDARP